MKNGLIAIVAMVAAMSAQASPSNAKEISAYQETVRYTSEVVAQNDGSPSVVVSDIKVGARILKDENGTCWKQDTKLTKMQEVQHSGITIQVPSTERVTQQVSCDQKP